MKELSNHLGNVLATVSDKKIAVMNGANLSYYRADVVSYSDYYPFGAPMTERTASLSDVRYGFNGKEMDSEGMGGGLSTYDYGFRIYNPHIAKFLSTDPLSKDFPFLSCYQFAGNEVIRAIDLDGLEQLDYRVLQIDQQGNAIVQLSVAPNTRSRDNRGVLRLRSLASGNVTGTFGNQALDMLLNTGQDNRQGTLHPNIDEGIGSSPVPGASDYYIKLSNLTLDNQGIEVLNRTNEGNYVESTRVNTNSTQVSSSFILSVPPITPRGQSPMHNIGDPNIFGSEVMIAVGEAAQATGQSPNQIMNFNVSYPSNELYTNQVQALTNQIRAQYPNANVSFMPTNPNDEFTSVNVEALGTAQQSLTVGQ